MIVANPVDLLAWAVATGRVRAVDYAAWLGYLTGPAAGWYTDSLIFGDIVGVWQFPARPPVGV